MTERSLPKLNELNNELKRTSSRFYEPSYRTNSQVIERNIMNLKKENDK